MQQEMFKSQIRDAISANDLTCGHKGKCSTCPLCKDFNDDGFPVVREHTLETMEQGAKEFAEEVFYY